MEVKKNVAIRYDLIGVDQKVCQYLVSIILNSDMFSMNDYLEGRGAMPDLIGGEEWDNLIDFGNKLHQAMRE